MGGLAAERLGGVGVKRSIESDQALLERYADTREPRAREELILRYLPLAHRLARRYARSATPLEDLLQVASLALVKAVDRFDPDRGCSFATFATPTVLGELKRYFRDLGSAIHVPRDAQERALAIDAAVEDLTHRHRSPPTVDQLAAYLGASAGEVLDGLLAARARSTLSLDAPDGPGEDGQEDRTLGDSLGEEDQRLEHVEAAATVALKLGSLGERDRHALRLRFDEELTQREIAERLGISQMQVSRILRRALSELRERSCA